MTSFQILKQDRSSRGRSGLLQVGRYKIRTPIFWPGHSLKSGLNLSDAFGNSDFPLLVSFGDLLGREKLHERIASAGIHKYLHHSGPILADSGGFKFMTRRHLSVSVEALVEFYVKSGVTIGVSLDHPFSFGESKKTNQRRWQQTLRNLETILELAPDVLIIPVVHAHSLTQLESACENVRSIIQEPLLIGLGSLVPMIKSSYIGKRFRYQKDNGEEGNHLSFIADAVKVVRGIFPRSVLHAFGAGGPTSIIPLYAIGVDSVDSVAWRIKASYGAILLHGTSDRFLSDRPDSSRKRRTLNQSEKDLLADCQCPTCSRLATYEDKVRVLEESFRARAIHNAWIIMLEVESFRRAIVRNQGSKYLSDILRPEYRLSGIVANLL